MTDKNRAALYARVSTDEQALEGYSLDAQMKYMEDFCEVQGLQIAGRYVDDGYSGTNIHRKAYQRMFSSAERKNWDVLVVLKMDRIHRNSKNFMLMMEDLSKHGQEFISTQDRINTSTAVGRFVMDMIQRIAQLESEQIGERTYMGMREKAQTGQGLLGFTPPYGYRIDDGRLVVDTEEFAVITDIFGMYMSGEPMEAIADKLNFGGKGTRKGNTWNKFNLRTVLHNPVYAGYVRWDGFLQLHGAEAAVSPEDFNAVQDLMVSKVRDPAKRHVDYVPTDGRKVFEPPEKKSAAAVAI